MLTQMLTRLGSAKNIILQQARRNIGVSAAVAQKVDPIQQLFVDKVRDYSKKSKSAGGKLVDATPKIEQTYKDELDKVDRMFGATGKDMTQFPTFNFTDPDLAPVGLQDVKASVQVDRQQAEVEEVQEDRNKPYFDIL